MRRELNWSYSVVAITLDFESNNPGSNPGKTYCFSISELLFRRYKTICPQKLCGYLRGFNIASCDTTLM